MAIRAGTVRPTRRGIDVETPGKQFDAHVRLERPPGSKADVIAVYLFDGVEPDPDLAWIDTEEFPNTPEGAREATRFLADWGFEVTIVPPAIAPPPADSIAAEIRRARQYLARATPTARSRALAAVERARAMLEEFVRTRGPELPEATRRRLEGIMRNWEALPLEEKAGAYNFMARYRGR